MKELIDNKELVIALEELEKEKGIKKDYVIEAIETALVTAYKRNFDAAENVKVVMDKVTGATHIYSTKEVVEDLISKNLIGNYNEATIVDVCTGKYYWETLSARLPPFRVLNAKCGRFYPMEHQKLHCTITHQDL